MDKLNRLIESVLALGKFAIVLGIIGLVWVFAVATLHHPDTAPPPAVALTWTEVHCTPAPTPVMLNGKLQSPPAGEAWWVCPDGSVQATDQRNPLNRR